MTIEQIIESVGQLNAPDFQRLVDKMAGMSFETFMATGDDAFRKTANNLILAAECLSDRCGN